MNIDKAAARTFGRSLLNPTFVVGLVLLGIAFVPLLILGLIQSLGFMQGNNGLGFGLLMFAAIGPAIICLLVGLVVALVRAFPAPRI